VLLDAGLLTIPDPEPPPTESIEPAATTSDSRPDDVVRPDDTSPNRLAKGQVTEERAVDDERPIRLERPPADTVAARPKQPAVDEIVPRPAAKRTDTTAAAPDTATIRTIPDAVAALSDSVAADTAGTKSGGVGATPADTTTTSPDTMAVAPDTTVTPPEPEPLRLQSLYERLVALYPQSPQAERARLVIDALEERRQAAAADSAAQDTVAASDSATVVPDTTMADADGRLVDEALGDEVRAPEPGYEDAPAADTTDAPAAGEGPAALRLREQVDRERSAMPSEPSGEASAPPEGAWFLLVATTTQRSEADARAATLREQLSGRGLPVHVVEVSEDGAPAFKVGAGNYPSREAAETVRNLLSEVMPESAVPYRIPSTRQP
jgi:hypothetical protein